MLVSLLNACILLVAVGVIFAESIDKLKNPTPIAGGSVAWVAGVGIVINAFTAWLFLKDKEKDLNVKGAYLHMAADTLVSVGVLISGIVISFTGWYVIDPIIGMVIAVVILISTAHLLHDSLRLSLDSVPARIDSERIERSSMQIWRSQTSTTCTWAHQHDRERPDSPYRRPRHGTNSSAQAPDQTPARTHGNHPRHPGIRTAGRDVRRPGMQSSLLISEPECLFSAGNPSKTSSQSELFLSLR